MPVKTKYFKSLDDIINIVSQKKTQDIVFIVPGLEIKKTWVERLALQMQTVPDHHILRLNEFFKRLSLESEPSLQFLDKDLISVFLKSQISNSPDLSKYTPLIDVSIDYISIFAPLLGNPDYRQIFEDYIQEDEFFLKNYGDLYPFLIRIWDLLLEDKRILPAWSLGWLYKNMEQICELKKEVYILGLNRLKKIEKAFFEQMSEFWDIYEVDFEQTGQKQNNNNYLVEKIAPVDEINWCLNFLKNHQEERTVNFIAPQSKWFYKEVLEVYCQNPKFLSDIDLQEKTKNNYRAEVKNYLSQLNLMIGQYDAQDLRLYLQSLEKEKFKNYSDFKKQTQGILDISALKTETQKKTIKPTGLELEGEFNFMDFLNLSIGLLEQDSELILKKIYPLSVNIPLNLKLSFKDWLSFMTLKLEKISTPLQSQRFNFYTLEEIDWQENEINIFLGCTTSEYEKNPFAYLSEYEIGKIRSDLGFDLEGMATTEHLIDDLKKYFQLSIDNYFLCPQTNEMGAAQQQPKFIQSLKNESRLETLSQSDFSEAFKSVQIREDINLCKLSSPQIISLSATSLQKYIDAPYEYFLDQALKLKDEPVLDVDPSDMLLGSILHKLLEKAVADPSLAHYEALQKIVQKDLEKNYKVWSTTQASQIQVNNYIQSIVDYIQKDEESKKNNARKTLCVEQKFEAFFDPTDLKFHKTYKPGRTKFTGKIDRIDQVEDRLFLIDYKSSESSAKNLKNILKKPKIQMPLYAMIVEDGVLDIQGEVCGLLYIAIKNEFKEITSLMIKDYAKDILPGNRFSGEAFVNVQDFKAIIQDYRLYLKHSLEEMQKGFYNPYFLKGELRDFHADY